MTDCPHEMIHTIRDHHDRPVKWVCANPRCKAPFVPQRQPRSLRQRLTNQEPAT